MFLPSEILSCLQVCLIYETSAHFETESATLEIWDKFNERTLAGETVRSNELRPVKASATCFIAFVSSL